MDNSNLPGYRYSDPGLNGAHEFLLPKVLQILAGMTLQDADKRLFELGCGNGSVANALSQRGWDVTGVDPSSEGIALARNHYPELKLEMGSAYDDLVSRYGRYPVILSLEVIEHVYFPRHYARTLFDLLDRGGTAIISTPYHGYWKNLALAVTGRMDDHFTALWEHGHIKFWSFTTLGELLRETGFVDVRFKRVGRVPPLAKSMIAIAEKP
ncbi:MAG: class I SAM-dependent methyltransferase [Gammaproteobacteria bacterium]